MRRSVACAALGLALLGCSAPVEVHSAYDRSASFAAYRTFAMLLPNKPIHDATGMDPFLMQRLRQFTYEALVARGLAPAPAEQADLLVGVVSSARERVEVYPSSAPGYPYRGPGFSYDVRTYTEGTVVLDLIDRAESAVVWRGTGQRAVGRALTDEELREVVARVLAQYPPGVGQGR